MSFRLSDAGVRKLKKLEEERKREEIKIRKEREEAFNKEIQAIARGSEMHRRFAEEYPDYAALWRKFEEINRELHMIYIEHCLGKCSLEEAPGALLLIEYRSYIKGKYDRKFNEWRR